MRMAADGLDRDTEGTLHRLESALEKRLEGV